MEEGAIIHFLFYAKICKSFSLIYLAGSFGQTLVCSIIHIRRQQHKPSLMLRSENPFLYRVYPQSSSLPTYTPPPYKTLGFRLLTCIEKQRQDGPALSLLCLHEAGVLYWIVGTILYQHSWLCWGPLLFVRSYTRFLVLPTKWNSQNVLLKKSLAGPKLEDVLLTVDTVLLSFYNENFILQWKCWEDVSPSSNLCLSVTTLISPSFDQDP